MPTIPLLSAIPWRHLLAVAALAGAGYAGWWTRDLQAEAAEGARLKAEDGSRKLLRELADGFSASTEKAIGGIRVTNQTIHQKAIHEVQTNTIYGGCVLPDAGRMLVNQARSAANADGGTLPAATAPK